jgi:hypothetical protein
MTDSKIEQISEDDRQELAAILREQSVLQTQLNQFQLVAKQVEDKMRFFTKYLAATYNLVESDSVLADGTIQRQNGTSTITEAPSKKKRGGKKSKEDTQAAPSN